MARQPRYALPGQVQHVIQRGNNREAIFFRDDDYRFYLHCLAEACAQQQVDVHAYVLMPNHVHLLLTPSRAGGISKVMQSVSGRYAQYVNSTYRRTGTVWGGRYRSTIVDPHDYLLRCMCYIELNPVRSGLVTHPNEYPWSSFHGNARGAKDLVVVHHPVYQQLGENSEVRRARYHTLLRLPTDPDTVTEIRNATNKGWVLGDETFRLQLESILKRRVQPLPRGGDRRSVQARQQRSIRESDPFVISADESLMVSRKSDEPR